MNHSANPSVPVVLTMAGFDPSGGAGIVADLKTFAAHNCYGVAAITALTVQNSQGVRAVYPVETSIFRESVNALLADGNVKAIKIGMVGNRANAEVISSFLEANPGIPAILDPIQSSSAGTELTDREGFAFVRSRLLAQVSLVTPNLAEASALSGLPVSNLEEMKGAARRLIEMGARAVVITGGHLEKAIDFYLDGSGSEVFTGDRLRPDNTHGTGCTFSSAIAANVALGRQLRDAVVLAKAYVTEAIRKAYPVSPHRLPLNHFHRMQQGPRLDLVAVTEPAH
jgi:hydroxymethylpyrimidine/phosphomethylpyrimidine kinase